MLGFLSRINMPYKEDDVSCVGSEVDLGGQMELVN